MLKPRKLRTCQVLTAAWFVLKQGLEGFVVFIMKYLV